MEQSFGICFFIKRHKNYSHGEAHVYVRITIDGSIIDISTKRKCSGDSWNKGAGRMKLKDDGAALFNSYLDTFQQKIFEAKRKLIELDKPITGDNIKDLLLGREIDRKCHMLMEIFKQHNEQMKALIGVEYAAGTHERYVTSYKHTNSFIKAKYKIEDIDIKKLKYEFIEDYEFWLKSTRKCDHNSTVKYLANFRKIINGCVRKGWLQKDPFTAFKMTKREVERHPLTESELQKIVDRKFPLERLRLVKDIFIFACYTGLAYIDIAKLKRSEIITGIDGEPWISCKRQKTDTPSKIPLLAPALKILAFYEAHPQCRHLGKVLPVFSNQKMNAYLKEIADLCGITKNLTFHIARHTFATTITLSNGVPIETVSKMLGHRNLLTTQHYAKILDIKTLQDMRGLKEKFR